MAEIAEVSANPNYLLVAGVHDKESLGWAAASAWLELDSNHKVVATFRSPKAGEFLLRQDEASEGRVGSIEVDWTKESADLHLEEELNEFFGEEGGDRPLSGFVHSVAAADRTNFDRPAHEISPDVYLEAFNASTLSLLNGVRGARKFLTPNAGIVTFGFGRDGTYTEGYGAGMSVAKRGLSQLVIELAASLGRADPSARTLEIVPGFIPTYAGKGVAAAQRVRHAHVSSQFEATALLGGSDAISQRAASALMAVRFMIDPMFSQTTGQVIHTDGGWSLRGPNLFPPANSAE